MITFLVLGEVRSGNHFLRDLLSSTRKVRVIDRSQVTNESSASKLILIKLKQLERDRPIGLLPIHPTHRNLSVMLPNLFRTLGYYPKCVWLVRRDKIAQAVSFIRAKKTKVYSLHRKSTEQKRKLNQLEIDISEQDLHRYMTRCLFGDQAAETFCIRHGITPYKIFYEDLLGRDGLGKKYGKTIGFSVYTL